MKKGLGIAVGFDERDKYRYSRMMKRPCPSWVFAIPLATIALSSCSFNYGAGPGAEDPYPEMILSGVVAERYESAAVSLEFSADVLEIYDEDRLWAANGARFTQFDAPGSGAVESEASASVLIVDDKNGVYSLGGEVRFSVASEGIVFSAPALRWTKETHRLVGAVDGEVTVEENDGTVIRGRGFFADTLRRAYDFSGPVSGTLSSTDAETPANVAASADAMDGIPAQGVDQP